MTGKRGGSVVLFFTLTYAVMWTCFGSVAALGVPADSLPGTVLILLGAYSPSLVALGLTARAQGNDGVRALLARVLQWRVAAHWYLFAAGYTAGIKIAVAVAHRVIADAWPRFDLDAWYLIPFAIAVSTPFQAGEEIGWRGYALPRLADRFGLRAASVVLGLIWAVWHLPQFFIPQADTYGQSFVVYAMQVTALSIAMAWLYAKTGGSVLLVMLMHAAANNSKDIVPSAAPGSGHLFGLSASLVAWLTLLFLWLFAAYFLVRMPKWEPVREIRA